MTPSPHPTRNAAAWRGPPPSNFYYAFYMLPRPKRDALCAFYAFMRLVDDVSDAPATETSGPASTASPESIPERTAGLARWRALLDQAVAGDTSAHPILPAFADTIHRYRIPPRYFHDLISGAEMDLTETHYATFDRLREYCYRVAGTVGLTCLHVFGFDDPHAPELAERLGIAFQLTNIMRDVGGDLAMGRVYLPAEDLARFGCSARGIKARRGNRVGQRTAPLRNGPGMAFLRRGRPADSVDSQRQPRRAMGAGADLQHAARADRRARLSMSFPSRVRLIVRKKRGFCCARVWAGVRRRMSSKSVIVIGGGLAGLSSAVALAEAGFRVRLLEQRPYLGWPCLLLRVARRRARGQLPARDARLLHESRRFLQARRRRRQDRLL